MPLSTIITLAAAGVGALIALWAFLTVLGWRTIVDTNKVHIVQTAKKTTSYGVGQANGNVYYRIPAWVPMWGISMMELPVNNFKINLDGYKAYDKDRVPFDLDVVAFFRIFDTNIAAARVASFDDLRNQLVSIVQGAVRKILASHDIHTVMIDRATFGDQFTQEVKSELVHWGVEPVKNLELMDIRDESGSKVIASIMMVKTSQIEADSRKAVAENEQAARSAEIASKQAIAMSEQDSEQQVGERTAQQQQAVGIAKEKAEQAIQDQLAVTQTKVMAVKAIETQRQAEITRDAAVVAAEQAQRTSVINADAAKQVSITQAQAANETAKLQAAAVVAAAEAAAQSTRVKGEAEGAARLALEMAPVNAQLAMAKEIGGNQGYQEYLVKVEQVKMSAQVGMAQAEALKSADLKIIASGGNIDSGLNSLGEIFSPKGATNLAGTLTALAATPEGQALVTKLIGDTSTLKAQAASTAKASTPKAS